MKKVFLIKAHSGSYDSYHSWVHAIYEDEQSAITEKDRLNLEWEAKKNIPCPFPIDQYGDLIDEDLLSKEESKAFYDWWHVNHEAAEWNKAEVFEFELGKTYPR